MIAFARVDCAAFIQINVLFLFTALDAIVTELFQILNTSSLLSSFLISCQSQINQYASVEYPKPTQFFMNHVCQFKALYCKPFHK